MACRADVEAVDQTCLVLMGYLLYGYLMGIIWIFTRLRLWRFIAVVPLARMLGHSETVQTFQYRLNIGFGIRFDRCFDQGGDGYSWQRF